MKYLSHSICDRSTESRPPSIQNQFKMDLCRRAVSDSLAEEKSTSIIQRLQRYIQLAVLAASFRGTENLVILGRNSSSSSCAQVTLKPDLLESRSHNEGSSWPHLHLSLNLDRIPAREDSRYVQHYSSQVYISTCNLRAQVGHLLIFTFQCSEESRTTQEDIDLHWICLALRSLAQQRFQNIGTFSSSASSYESMI